MTLLSNTAPTHVQHSHPADLVFRRMHVDVHHLWRHLQTEVDERLRLAGQVGRVDLLQRLPKCCDTPGRSAKRSSGGHADRPDWPLQDKPTHRTQIDSSSTVKISRKQAGTHTRKHPYTCKHTHMNTRNAHSHAPLPKVSTH